ncbi:DUF1853 family protein [Gallaecimonas sp. GXIMD1310]|uniref:DUF1853 family protein n=1 Tax=Gallaecimonas sp. GXIMD1310 TaxID=3131926 RepID=UPI00324C8D30
MDQLSAQFDEQDALAMLRWVIGQPPLLALVAEPAALSLTGVDTKTLAAALSQERRLGKRFEVLVHALLEASDRYQVLAADEAIRINGQTLGAPDLIVRDLASGTIEHWELTVKFYLGLPQGWLGPGQRDWLEHKAARLANHQLPLLSRPELVPWLTQRGWHIHQRRLLSRGVLFGQGPRHNWLDRRHSQGQWWYPEQWPAALALRPLARWQWLAEVAWEALPELTEIHQPTMVMAADGSRHMLVPRQWPELKKEP